ncbi:hypothetical protein BDM02DRAFT_3120991 [Thelephora ganbajun]|uniref:Uncharacterized protein n=1 Tax=Thelephora ganbajun TaxID=370292 RepID=A0ACB6Z5V2_THEGA|nr:hypothetical protein BDM02DRAFT_3120991 [Thelephora ganbajun]
MFSINIHRPFPPLPRTIRNSHLLSTLLLFVAIPHTLPSCPTPPSTRIPTGLRHPARWLITQRPNRPGHESQVRANVSDRHSHSH